MNHVTSPGMRLGKQTAAVDKQSWSSPGGLGGRGSKPSVGGILVSDSATGDAGIGMRTVILSALAPQRIIDLLTLLPFCLRPSDNLGKRHENNNNRVVAGGGGHWNSYESSQSVSHTNMSHGNQYQACLFIDLIMKL